MERIQTLSHQMNQCPHSELKNNGRHLCPAKKLSEPIKVTVTGAAGNIGYALVFMIAQGRCFGPNQPVILTLLEIPQMKQALEGVKMELLDGAYPLIAGVNACTTYKDGFDHCQVAILVGAKPRGPGMERKDLLGQNGLIFKGQGQALNNYADKNCKVIVVGNPANTNAMIAAHYCPNIPAKNFTALTRLDQNRAVGLIADKVGTAVRNVRNIIIWGNHSLTQYPDVSQGIITNHPTQGLNNTIYGAVNNNKWLEGDFISTVAKRGAAIIQARKLSSAASAASAVCDHIHDWLVGTQPGQYASMAVMSNGDYGIPRGICFSLPVQCQGGKYFIKQIFEGEWTVVKNLKWSEFSDKLIQKTTQELMEEKSMAFEYLDSQK